MPDKKQQSEVGINKTQSLIVDWIYAFFSSAKGV